MTVSFIVAAKDEAFRIESCLRSLQSVAHVDDEIIVVDDGSSDATSEVIGTMNVPNLRLLRNERSVGRATARNQAIQASRGKYLAIQDADDRALPDRLRAPVGLLESNRQLVAAGGQCVTVTSKGRPWRHMRFPLTSEEIRNSLLRAVSPMCHTGSVLRRSAVEHVGGYDASFIRAQDLDLFMRLSEVGPIQNSPKDVVAYTHDVFLDWRYWSESRAYTLALRDEDEPRIARLARYPVAMARRTLKYMCTTQKAKADLQTADAGW